MRRSAAVLGLVLLLVGSRTAADPPPTHIQTDEPRLLCVPPISATARCREIPPGHFVDELTWQRIDVKLRETENRGTRLEAENKALRKSMSGWRPGWRTIVTTLVVGLVGGAYVHHKL